MSLSSLGSDALGDVGGEGIVEGEHDHLPASICAHCFLSQALPQLRTEWLPQVRSSGEQI